MVRPLTESVFSALMLDLMPEGPAAITDFGIETPDHFSALSLAVRQGEISLEDLDRALGNGPLLTKLVRAARSNPHKAISFKTPWDEMHGFKPMKNS